MRPRLTTRFILSRWIVATILFVATALAAAEISSSSSSENYPSVFSTTRSICGSAVCSISKAIFSINPHRL